MASMHPAPIDAGILGDLRNALAVFGRDRASCLRQAFLASMEVERASGGPRASTFRHEHIARSLHGCGHAARVSVWSAWLTLMPRPHAARCPHLSGQPAHGVSVEQECHAAIVAAFIHDTGRHNEWVDHAHGDASADHLGDHLLATVAHPHLAADALEAVRLHSRHESDAGTGLQRTRAWAILKDADGLDWGRFGTPTSGWGCDIAYLRTRAASDMAVVWMAWHLAEAGPSGGWSDRPVAQVWDAFRVAVAPLAEDPDAGPVAAAILD